MEITSRVAKPFRRGLSMVNFVKLQNNLHLQVPARKLVELYDKSSNEGITTEEAKVIMVIYQRLKKEGVIVNTGRSASENIKELHKYYGKAI